MNTIKGSTVNETKMIKGIQFANSSLVDGLVGTQTMSDLACKLNADCFPLTLEIYNRPVIISNDFNVITYPNSNLSLLPNTTNGSFLSGTTIWSVCVTHGKIVHAFACHQSLGYPESVLYRYNDNSFGIMRVKSVTEIPNYNNISWAIGGCGLLDFYNPNVEGFKQIENQWFGDVIQKNNHTMLGVKNGYTYQVFCEGMTGIQINNFAKLLELEKAILVDGGHLAAMNGSESFAKKNIKQKQYFVIQGI